MLDPLLFVELAGIGLITGFLAGLLGIGGGMMLVPVITFVLDARAIAPDLAVKMAIATSMATIVFTSISSVRAHHRRGAVRWDLVARLTPGIVLGAALASGGIFRWLQGRWLALLFGIFIGLTALQMLRRARVAASTRTLPSTAGLVGAGGVIGFASGLVGAGGGFLSVPFMTAHRVPMHQAVATSAALGLPIALANVLGYIWAGADVAGRPAGSLGYVFAPALVAVASSSVLAAPLGVRAAHALPVPTLKRVFAVALLGVAAAMIYRAWSG
ncbi:sulfite exporter TauE/SafE family protein [Tepidimonas sp.]|uniref:sulfite exporter TauE/SafE family protein n=1 Tax=Tepidimonas sp. TaxID=2002775 RepID=UPI002FE1365B